MSSVDDRIVNMQFNNSQFNSGISSSMSLLDKLKEKLNLPGSKPKVDFSGITNGVSNVASKFSALQTVAAGALMRIGSIAADVGANIAKSLTIQPIMDGFSEYEGQINSLRVIVANLPNETNEHINAALDELNTYADKTIYSFGDMTKAIGLFTASGVGLEQSVQAIKGLSNLAAGAGSDNATLARAEYQTSQALKQGYFALMDYRSLQNANLTTPEFEKNLMEVARAHNIPIDSFIKKYGSLAQSLSKEKWLTSDIFLETIARASDETTEWGKRLAEAATKISSVSQLVDTLKEEIGTGWGTSFKTIFGDLPEARELFTGINDQIEPLISGTADFRNAILNAWDAMGGRAALFNTQSGALFRTLRGLTQIANIASKAFQNVFGGVEHQSNTLVTFSKHLQSLSDTFQIFVRQHIPEFTNVFRGVFSVFNTAGKVISVVVKNFKELANAILPSSKSILTVASDFGKWLYQLDRMNVVAPKVNKVLHTINEGIINFVNGVKHGASTIADAVKQTGLAQLVIDNLTKAFTHLRDIIPEALKNIGSFAGELADAIGNQTAGIITKMSEVFKGMFGGGSAGQKGMSGIAEGFNGLAESLKNWAKTVTATDVLTFLNSFITLITAGRFAAVGKTIKGVLDTISDTFASIQKVPEGISGMIESVSGALKGMQNDLNAGALIKIGIAIGILALDISYLASVDPEDVARGLGAVAGALAELVLTLKGISKIENLGGSGGLLSTIFGSPTAGVTDIAKVMLELSVAVGIMAIVTKKLGEMDQDELNQGLVAVALFLGELVGVVAILSKLDDMQRVGGQLILISMAIGIMADVTKKMGELDADAMSQGLGAIVIFSTVVVALSYVMSKLKGSNIADAASLIMIGVAFELMADVTKKMGNLEEDKMALGLGAITLFSIIVAALSYFMDQVKGSNIKNSIAILLVGVAFELMGDVVDKMGKLEPAKLAQGLVALGIMSLIVGVLSKVMDGMDGLASGGGILIAAQGIEIMAGAVTTLANIPAEKALVACSTMAIAVGILSGAISLLGGLGIKAISGAASLTIASFGIKIFADAMKTLSDIGAGGLLVSLSGMAIGLTLLVGAAYLVTPVIPGLLALGGACLMVGAGTLMAGAGLLMAAQALTLFAGVVGSVVLAVAGLLMQLLSAIAAVGPQVLQVVADIVSGIWGALVQFFTVTLPTVLPIVGQFLLGLLESVISLIATYGPMLIQAGADALMSFITGITTNLGQIVMAGLTTLNDFITGLNQGLDNLALQGIQTVVSFLSGILSKISEVGSAGIRTLTSFVTGIIGHIGQALSAGTQTVGNFISGIGSRIGSIVGQGAQAIGNFISGIGSRIGSIIGQGRSAASNFISGVSGMFGRFVSAGADMIHGLISGIGSAIGGLVSAAANAAASALSAAKSALGIGSPSKEFAKVSVWSIAGAIVGIKASQKDLNNASEDSANSALSAFSDALDANADFTPTITPILDLSNIQNGSKMIGSMLDQSSSIAPNPSMFGISSGTQQIDSSYLMQSIRRDLKDYTNAILSRPQNIFQMGDAIINDHEDIRNDFITLITDLSRRADMNHG